MVFFVTIPHLDKGKEIILIYVKNRLINNGNNMKSGYIYINIWKEGGGN